MRGIFYIVIVVTTVLVLVNPEIKQSIKEWQCHLLQKFNELTADDVNEIMAVEFTTKTSGLHFAGATVQVHCVLLHFHCQTKMALEALRPREKFLKRFVISLFNYILTGAIFATEPIKNIYLQNYSSCLDYFVTGGKTILSILKFGDVCFFNKIE